MRAYMRWTLAFAFFQFLLNFCLQRKACLGFQQPVFVLLEAVERLDESASRQCGEVNHAHVHTSGRGRRMDWLLYLALGWGSSVNHLPAVCRTATLFASPEDIPAVAVADPAGFQTLRSS